MKKKILGLDLGTNSIGWALVDKSEQKIVGLGARIVPIDGDLLGDFEKGNKISQTAVRTQFRGIRRLIQRSILRRERLHRVLNQLGFLPKHYREKIDFEKKLGQFVEGFEPLLAYAEKNHFIFENSYQEMCQDFLTYHPELFSKNSKGKNKKIPYHWTIYYLRKKALTQKITQEELAWLLLNFNEKRGYYQTRGEEIEQKENKKEEFLNLKILEVQEKEQGKSGTWYEIKLENGWIYKRESKISLHDWVGKKRDFIVSTDLDEKGEVLLNKEGQEKRSFRSPKEDDWGLIKIKTEQTIHQSEKSVGVYIYEKLLKNPKQKIRGKLVRTIERDFYKKELEQILKTQIQFHPALKDPNLYQACIEELYRSNEAHRHHIANKGFDYLFIEDIIFYHRPLKSKVSQIADCPLESRFFIKDEKKQEQPIKCIAKSHPVFQEFRLWQWIKNVKIYQKAIKDIEVTENFIKTEENYEKLFDFLNDKKDIDQKQFLRFYRLKEDQFRWNFPEDKTYPCNETRAVFLEKAKKIEDFDLSFFNPKNTQDVWHILYSVNDPKQLITAIDKFTQKHNLPLDFVKIFSNLAPYKNEYGSFSYKAIQKLLPLMRMGKYWKAEDIHPKIKEKIQKIIDGEFDENTTEKVREKLEKYHQLEDFKGLPLWLASYVVYNRHSENKDTEKWEKPQDIQHFLTYFKQHSLRNPIVEQMIRETLQTIKEIWEIYGEGKNHFFDEIHIELGREMKNPSDKRKKIHEKNTENENTNLRIRKILEELKNAGNTEVRPYSPSQQEILKLYEEGVFLNEKNKIKLEEIQKIRKNNAPTHQEIRKYKLWLEQGYISPYTGAIIALHELFSTQYQIEHIFPQSRFFDDSISNKIICESEVNGLKNNQTAMEFIQNHGGEKVQLSNGKTVEIFKPEAYQKHIEHYFSGNKTKMKNLLSAEIPESFINRQLNDSRYISKIVKNLLNKLVREEKDGLIEQEGTSKNIVVVNGAITSKMKQDWGLDHCWNHLIVPRFERLNQLTGTQDFGYWDHKNGKQVFQINMPEPLSKGFSKKRIDHRHHALDALVIACVDRNHINYLNYLNAKNDAQEREKWELKQILCRKKHNEDGSYQWEFKQPWENFTQEAKEKLETTLVSFKQNQRILTKTNNTSQKFDEKGKKILMAQTKTNLAIRKSLHKDTVFAKVLLKRDQQTWMDLNYILKDSKNIENIIDKSIKKKIQDELILQQNNLENLKKHFKKSPLTIDEKPVGKIKIYEWVDAYATRKKLDDSFDQNKIAKITDLGIQKILSKHLEQENNDPALAFSQEGIEKMNTNLKILNEGKDHQPIFAVRWFEEGNKFKVGEKGNKKDKYVEAAKGTNLFFAIYQDLQGKRTYETIGLKTAIERKKQGLSVAQEQENKKLLFVLSPNDLVYVPSLEEQENPNLVNFNNLNLEQMGRIYKFVSADPCFVPFYVAKVLFDLNKKDQKKNNLFYPIQNELGVGSPMSKSPNSLEGVPIKEVCWKLEVNRLGQITHCITAKKILSH